MELRPRKMGFAVKVLGEGGIKASDTRRWQSNPHLRVSLGYLRDVFAYLERTGIRMYRMSSDLAPYLTHPEKPAFHGQVAECRLELRDLGVEARRLGLRLSFHPSQFIVLNSPDPKLRKQSVADVASQAEMLDCMGMGPEAVVVIHVGGAYGDPVSGRERWAKCWASLPEHARRRLVLENDDTRFSAADVLWIHGETGVSLVFDHQHFWCYNPERLELYATARRFLATWPAGVRPKIHFSSPRTEAREVKRTDPRSGKAVVALLPPVWTGHADFTNPFEFIAFMRALREAEFDVMLEAKSKDLAVLRLRADLAQYAADLAPGFA